MTRILVVEDSHTQAHALVYILETEGFTTELAHDAEQALERIRSSTYDLIITDVVLPGLSGYQLCRKIKEDPTRKHIPVILLTVLNDPLDILRGIECGADNFLTKPYDPASLISRLRFIFATRSRRGEGKVKVGVEVSFLGQTFTISSEKEQILDLLISTCEDIVRVNKELRASEAELAAAKARVEQYARYMESQARSSRDKYRRLMEQALDAIFILNPEGDVLEINRQAEQLLGVPTDEILLGPYERFVPADELPVWKDHFRTLLGDGHIRWNDAHVRRPGELICVDYSITRVDIEGDRVIMALVRDVTDRNRLEEQLLQAQKMEAMGRLAGGVAHDFNNLLTVINGYGQVLLQRLPEGDFSRELIREMTFAGERAAGLTQQLLAFSRQQVLEPQVIHLDRVVRDAERLLRRLITEDIELTLSCEDGAGPVLADPIQIVQVLMNLVVNARDAMPRGGKLKAEMRNVELNGEDARSRSVAEPGKYARLSVSDTGCGMTPEVLARIWEPFFTTKEVGKGTGLGLATVYGIVKQSKGFIRVESEPGLGTTFEIHLPIVQKPAPVPAPVPAARIEPASGGGETILIAEDEDSVRALTRHVLQSNGYVVLEARDGEEALALCGQHAGKIDLVVSDVVMPRLGGRDLADRLAQVRPGLKLLFLSGYTDDAVMRHGILEKEVAFLQKPYSPAALVQKVREVLGG